MEGQAFPTTVVTFPPPALKTSKSLNLTMETVSSTGRISNQQQNTTKRRRLVYNHSQSTTPSRNCSNNSLTKLEMNHQQQRTQDDHASETLVQLLEVQDWDGALDRVRTHPEEAAAPRDPSPLALACRYGAPLPCVEALLHAAPHKVRHSLDARGTPIHEAIVCETVGAETIAALLQVDEQLGTSTTPRAALMQDVDGYTTLHLLIRRRFQSHILYEQDPTRSAMMQILEMLVQSCPEAVVIPGKFHFQNTLNVWLPRSKFPVFLSHTFPTSNRSRRIRRTSYCLCFEG